MVHQNWKCDKIENVSIFVTIKAIKQVFFFLISRRKMPCTDDFRDKFYWIFKGDNANPGTEKERAFHNSFYEAK